MTPIAHSQTDFDAQASRPATRTSAFHAHLRDVTGAAHDEVDSLFAAFDLTERESYAAFLTAHAMALVPVEDWADIGRLLPEWSGRKVALYEDLTALGLPMPVFASLNWPRGEAARWGAAYVLEGSRLGGVMLSRRVGYGLPSAYLASRHAPGGWKSLLQLMEEKAERGGEAWRQAAVESAERTFDLYAQAARRMIRR